MKLYKLASETVNFSFDWSPEVGDTETLTSVAVEVIAGDVVLANVTGTVNESDLSGNVQTVWVSGGSIGESLFVIRANIGSRVEARKYYIEVGSG